MKNTKSVFPYLILFFAIAIGLPMISNSVAEKEIVHIEVTFQNNQNVDDIPTLRAQLNQ